MKPYDHKKIEKKWQKVWDEKKVYQTLSAKKAQAKKLKPYYVLDMFPYPSGAGLHVGHPRGYIASDVFARMKRMQGYNVLHPMGYDAFGLPAEQFAVQNKIHPRQAVEKNVKTFRSQLEKIGFSYDWDRQVNTTDPEYYRWTQWIFLQIYNSYYDTKKNKACSILDLIQQFEKSGNTKVSAVCDADTKTFTAKEWKSFSELEQQKILMKYRLAYEGEASVNWCPEMGTVLANDEIVDGPNGPVSERGGFPVEKKQMRQWFMRITAYGDRLIAGLETIDWPESIKEIQKNWIGKSEGSEIDFSLVFKNDVRIFGQENKNSTQRDIVKVILRNKEGKILALKVKSDFGFDLPGGALEFGESITEAAERELQEETEYTNFKFVKNISSDFAHYYHLNKQQYFHGTVHTLLYDLSNEEKSDKNLQASESETDDEWFEAERLYSIFTEKSSYHLALKQSILNYIHLKESKIQVFTTRADTLFGVTYVVLAPEHALVNELKSQIKNWDEVSAYLEQVKNKSEIDRTDAKKEKTGVCLEGVFAINPANGEQVPVWVADYVLAGYGTGAVMAVPAHDERDFEFANNYDLPMRQVIAVNLLGKKSDHGSVEEFIDIKSMAADHTEIRYDCWSGYGFLKNSQKFDGLSSQDAKKKITEFVGGKLVTKYKFRDAIFARQRYWGEPIPLVHEQDGTISEVSLKNLPLELPNVKSYAPAGNGESPLATVKAWVNAGYETNTMPGWAGSSWYFLRYTDPKNKKAIASEDELDYWFGKPSPQPSPEGRGSRTGGGVDMYVGGAEHATGHLLYSRFWHKFLKDMGHVATEEPFKALRNQGMIGGPDGRKMSKRYGNVVNPDDVVAQFGADSLRVFEMFLGPFESHLPWSTDGIIGSRRFIEKVWRLAEKVVAQRKERGEYLKVLHKTIKKVTEDIASFSFNTAISSMMICANEFEKAESINGEDFKKFLQILAPFAPHVTDELWISCGEQGSIHHAPWPTYDPKLIIDDSVKMGIQVNGKVRAEIEIAQDATETDVKNRVLQIPDIIKWMDGKEIKKFIYIPKKIISIVV